MTYRGGTSLALERRRADGTFAAHYFVGDGIDIGAGADPLSDQSANFPQMRSCRSWDKQDGDAEAMDGLAAESFDFVYSSHCLEHLRRPLVAFARWWELVRPGGHLVVVVPDAHLYEQDHWPSRFNLDHKWRFSANPLHRAIDAMVYVGDLVRALPPAPIGYLVTVLDEGWRSDLEGRDQTALGTCECGIEMILQKPRSRS